MKFLAKLYFKIRSYFTSTVEFSRIKRQLKIADINFRPIHEYNHTLPNEADLKVSLRYSIWVSISYQIS